MSGMTIHIVTGSIALLSGAAAFTYRKGSLRHRTAGKAFCVSMMVMAASGSWLAYQHPSMLALIGGLLTLYLVASAWATVVRTPGQVGMFEVAACIVAIAIGGTSMAFGLEAASSESGLKNGLPAGSYYFFGTIALIAAALDVHLIIRGGISGSHRLARHLWRMGFAFFVASSAFFLGQAQLFPVWVRESPVLLLLGYLPLLLIVLWLPWVFLARRLRPVFAAIPRK